MQSFLPWSDDKFPDKTWSNYLPDCNDYYKLQSLELQDVLVDGEPSPSTSIEEELSAVSSLFRRPASVVVNNDWNRGAVVWQICTIMFMPLLNVVCKNFKKYLQVGNYRVPKTIEKSVDLAANLRNHATVANATSAVSNTEIESISNHL